MFEISKVYTFLGCKDIGIRKFVLLAKTHSLFLNFLTPPPFLLYTSLYLDKTLKKRNKDYQLNFIFKNELDTSDILDRNDDVETEL